LVLGTVLRSFCRGLAGTRESISSDERPARGCEASAGWSATRRIARLRGIEPDAILEDQRYGFGDQRLGSGHGAVGEVGLRFKLPCDAVTPLVAAYVRQRGSRPLALNTDAALGPPKNAIRALAASPR
jgi:hypothetical protein